MCKNSKVKAETSTSVDKNLINVICEYVIPEASSLKSMSLINRICVKILIARIRPLINNRTLTACDVIVAFAKALLDSFEAPPFWKS